MKRVDLIYNKLLELSRPDGVSASELSEILNISRANVSFDLNRLWEEGKVSKSSGRPVKYSISSKGQNHSNSETSLDRLLRKNESLAEPIEGAKAAILYPPKGMHCLILGETGVGKSMFADYMHEYATEMGVKKKDSPFIIFNCADYTNNPQLLNAQLFGVKKGAYTGAENDKEGLIEKANGGILFLDEVHRLPPEGQEAFFTFMDKGVFRRIGESDTRTADVLIISATTEDPSSVLLKTFTRRIPMTIKLPALRDRSAKERLELIRDFFEIERIRLDREIAASLNTMRALLSYDCPNNVGQLKADIQLLCAKAYSDFLTGKKRDVKITSTDLPSHIKEGLYNEKGNRILWNETLGEKINFFKFSKGEDDIVKQHEEGSIYDIIDRKVQELRLKGVSNFDIETILENDITKYFKMYIRSAENAISRKNLINILGEDTLLLIDKMFYYATTTLGRNFDSNTFSALALHVNTLIERLNNNKTIINPQLNWIIKQYPKEFQVAKECVNILEDHLKINVPEDEAGFITLFWVLEKENREKDKVKVILIAHGESTATSMADVANKLLGEDYVVAINAPIEVSPLEVLGALRAYVKNDMNPMGYLILVDMGSLTTFGETIEKEYGMPVRVVALVSTLHVLEATRKARLGIGLEEIYKDVISMNSYMFEHNYDRPTKEHTKKLVIVTACLTGEGTAVAMKSFLSHNLRYDKDLLEIIPLNFVDKHLIKSRLKEIEEEKEIIFIVSSFPIDSDLKQFNIQDVISLRVINELQEKVDIKTTLIKMEDVISENIQGVDGKAIYRDILDTLNKTKSLLRIELAESTLPGIILHIAFMINRIMNGQSPSEYSEKESFIEDNLDIYNAVKKSLEHLENKYLIEVSQDEICYIMNFFR
ncbi:sigma 54-interacting transcriptional regulator [Clostridium folliculivorans]|uniref:Transcriptional regulator n=1 Tax=Clostridium folliculivorans TaxID=2886038 RepID=A0A9W5Y6H9_9CLOT|nr:sigma-54-dependent transcriptional regulator [Clostridium folliculivorans]GKU27654.1 transcriptional regulator [Clostridium folliculivorans]GKU32417.1 transcriptional regulator [Clostridium folliculivorans]